MPKTVNVDTQIVKFVVPFAIGGVLGTIAKPHEPEEEAPFKERLVFDLVFSAVATVISSLAVQAAVSWINKNRR